MKRAIMTIGLMILFAGVLFGCGGKDELPVGNPTNPLGLRTESWVEGSPHIYNVSETNEKVMENGQFQYTFVYANGDIGQNGFAHGMEVFTDVVKKATGVDITFVSDEGLTYSADSKYVSYGHTTLLAQSGISVDKDYLGDSGFRIVTKDKSVFLFGGGGKGTSYAGFELLSQWFDYEILSPYAVLYNKNVTDITLCNYDITDIPDIAYRLANYGITFLDAKNSNLMRMYTQHEGIMAGANYHSATLQLLPPSTYREIHDKWYATTTPGNMHAQLCYTARGDSTEYNAMVNEMVERLKAVIDEYPYMENLTVTQSDTSAWCACKKCNEVKKKYGSDSATQVGFIHDVSEKIETWLNDERNGRKVKIYIFAYYTTLAAPKTIDNSKYCTMNENTGVIFAPIQNAFSKSYYADTNENIVTETANWKKITKNFAFWGYTMNGHYAMLPYNSFDTMPEQYKFYVENDVKWLFDQALYVSPYPSGFSFLKQYLNSELGWNCNLDYPSLIENFMKKYFMDAYEPMNNYLKSLRAQLSYISNCTTDTGIYNETAYNTKEWWPEMLARTWLSYCDQAFDSIEKYKTLDKELYDQLYERILVETMTPQYILITMYESSFTTNELKALKDEYHATTTRFGMENLYTP